MDRRRRPTPRAAVVPPNASSLITSPDRPRRVPLTEGVYLSTADGDYTLFSERVLIGRAPHCRVIVLDPLVSREHALLRISFTEVVIEDLRSANGVYVNNARIFEPCQLFDGDTILVGTNEMSVFQVGSSDHHPIRIEDPPPSPPRPGVATERSDALTVLGRLADRMLDQGLPAEAERVLSDHLDKLLQGARSGLPVPAATCAHAARFALILASRLRSSRWINYALELHLRAELPMTVETLALLEEGIAHAPGVDHTLYEYYVEWLHDAVSGLGPEGRDLLDRLERVRLWS